MEAEPAPTNPVSKIVGAPKDPKGVNFTHFLAFPLWDNYSSKIKEVQDKFAAFVAEKYPQHVKDYRFQGHKCQHLTIAMLMLDNDEKKQRAIKALQEVAPKLKTILQAPLKVKLSDVQTFPDSSENRVYFLDIDEKVGDYEKFLSVEDAIIRTFQDHGLLGKQQGGVSNLKIMKGNPPRFYTTPHATFMRLGNYVKSKTFSKWILPKIVDEFNKLHLVEGFGDVVLDKVDICIRFDFGAAGEYNHLARIALG